MRARGIIVLVKSNQLVKNIETKQLQLAKRDSAAIVLVFKAGAFRYWYIGCNIQPSSSSTIKNAALIRDRQLDFANDAQFPLYRDKVASRRSAPARAAHVGSCYQYISLEASKQASKQDFSLPEYHQLVGEGRLSISLSDAHNKNGHRSRKNARHFSLQCTCKRAQFSQHCWELQRR